ncbi:uncharacterized protein LOC127780852 [Oryza glaberrima]|uniref:Uncharacterized protein n=1 Tax=Oryza glumipatula TaxID=40148 RepID=A0A0D9YHJ3_9ORYZ|nr:uncharacterized protein LOC127780852 [Oryza glaberrima]
MAAARVLCKRLTPLFLAAHASSSSVTCAGAAAAARTGMALMKNNPMKPPFSDSINGAKRPFSSTSTKNTDPFVSSERGLCSYIFLFVNMTFISSVLTVREC